MDNRVSVISIIIKEEESIGAVNELLHEFREYIVGRMGIPYRDRGVSIISVVLDAPGDATSSLSGTLGMLDDDIRKDEGSLITFHDHEHLVIVFYIHLDSLYRRHVDVPFGHDDAVVQFDAALRAHQGTAGRVFRIPGLAYDSRNPKLAAVRHRYLQLGLLAERPQYGNILKRSFRPPDAQPLLGHELPGLA